MRDAIDGKPMLRHEAMRLQNMSRRALSSDRRQSLAILGD
jgi:hypothetical protein